MRGRFPHIAIDFETIPDDDALAEAPPEFEPRKNLKDPEKIRQDIERKEAEWEEDRIKNFSVDFRRARIVAAGAVWNAGGAVGERAWTAPDEEAEAKLLFEVWQLIRGAMFSGAVLVTFNGLSFDVPLLYWRSMKLGVVPLVPKWKFSKRFVDHPHFDIRAVLGDFDRYSKGGLDDYARWLGIASPKTEMDGSAVWDAYQEGRWDDIEKYVLEDAKTTALIYRRVAPFYTSRTSDN